MTRKTNNSSQSLTSLAAHALAMDNHAGSDQTKAPKTNSKQAPPTSRHTRGRNLQSSPTSSEEADTGLQADEDEGDEADEEEEDDDDDGNEEPAGFAPSARLTIGDGEQAGLLSEAVEGNTDLVPVNQSQRSRQSSHTGNSDDDYAGVNDISDSGEADSDVEKLEEKDIIEGENADPTSDLPEWDDLDAGVFGASETFFDQYPEAEYAASNILAGDLTGEYTDYHSAWEGIPDTPVETRATTPAPLPSPSSRKNVRFQLGTPTPGPSHGSGVESDIDDALSAGIQTRAGQVGTQDGQTSGDESNDGGSASGYETDDGGTTDEEEPPVPAQELVKAPHLLRRSSPSSLDTSYTSYVYTPSVPLPSTFKVPTTPASRRVGPYLGTFRTDPSRSYAMVDKTGKNLLIRHATRPSPLSTPRQSRVGSVTSNSAPPTPVTSHPTLSAAPDLSETEFSDAVASQISADPALSAGPDFVASAGFSRTAPRAARMGFPQTSLSSVFAPQESFPMITDFGIPAGVSQIEDDDDEDDELNLEDFISMPDDSDSEDEISIVSASSPISNSSAIDATTLSAQPGSKKSPSPSSTSSTPDINLFDSVGVTSFRNSTQRSQPRQPSNRPHHGLSLNGNALKGARPICPPSPPKKRKLSESHGSKAPPAPTGKRRITTSRR